MKASWRRIICRDSPRWDSPATSDCHLVECFKVVSPSGRTPACHGRTPTHVGAKNPPWFRRHDQLVVLLSGSECENSASGQGSDHVLDERGPGGQVTSAS